MKSFGVAVLACLAAPSLVVQAVSNDPSAATTPAQAAAPQAALSIPGLIADLSNDSFAVREEASQRLWQLGEAARDELKSAAGGMDPEVVHRATELLHKIDLHITPDTDPAVIALVERYAKATDDRKKILLSEMRKKRAYRQILKLYAAEGDLKLRASLQSVVAGIAVFAAREQLLGGDATGARELLELAPADARGLMALAAFHRAQGTLEDELQRARKSKAKGALAWQLALQRAAGRLTEAHAAAIDAGEPMLAATMAMLAGNPVPWFEHSNANLAGVKQTADTYTPLALKRWQGKAILRTDLDPTFKLLNSRNQATRALAFNSLFLLGESAAAEAALTKSTPLEAFAYFEALERIPEALAALGLDPQQPDYAAWVATRVEQLIKEPDDSDQATIALATIASFLENRGLQEDLANAFDKPLAHLAQKDVNAFTNFLGALFGEHSVRTGIVGPLMRVGTEWAGDDDARWDELVVAAFGDNEENLTCWKWLAELKPQATRKQRLAAMFALSGYGADPDHLRDTWLALAWAAITKAEPAMRPLLCKHLSALIGRNVDVANSLKIHDMNPPLAPGDELDGLYLLDLSAAGRWDEASRIFLKLFSSKDKLTENTRPDLHAYAATCLRRAGHPDEAAVHDVWVEKLALGDAATYLRIAHGYAFGGDYDRCSLWRERAAREAEPDNEEYSNILTVHAADLLRRGQWKPAAATAEALAQIYSGSNFGSDSTLSLLRMRLQADLSHALSLLDTDRARALAMLEKCHGMLPCDGALADHFFPALRKAGLVKQHDAWFEITWNLIQAVVKRYPDSHNTRNTAAWLACRALRHLDEAAAHLNKVLATHPYQAAYLDTMAELQFARGHRQQAIEWSDKAINFMPGDDDIRRQHHRFVNDPFPE